MTKCGKGFFEIKEGVYVEKGGIHVTKSGVRVAIPIINSHNN